MFHDFMPNHPKQERTFLMVKPDGVQRGLIGEVIHRIEKVGLKVVALKMFQPTHQQIDDHYPKEEAWIRRLGQKTLSTYQKYGYNPIEELGTDVDLEIGNKVRGWLVAYMSAAPLVKMVIEGVHAVDMVRKLSGSTFPYEASLGTIRGDFSVDSPALANKDKRSVHNIVHASETPEEASHEISHWFSPDEIFTYKRSEEV